MTDTFADWLAAMSKALGYTREADLARALDVPQSTVLRWRRGSRPSIDHLARLSAVLRTDLVALLQLVGHIEPGFVGAIVEPPTRRTETERRIDDAEISDDAREALRQYLAARAVEEDLRVRALLAHHADGDDEDRLDRIHRTDLPVHVARALRDLGGAPQ